MSVSETEPLCS